MHRSASCMSLALMAAAVFAPRYADAAAPCAVNQVDYSDADVYLFTGTPGKQLLRVELNDTDGGVTWLDCNGNGTFTDAAAGDVNGLPFYGNLEIQLKGNDTIVVNTNLSTRPWPGNDVHIKMMLGTGTNSVNVNGGTAFLGEGSLLTFDVLGGPGRDSLIVDFNTANLDQSALQIRADLGAGNDDATFRAPGLNGLSSYSLDVNLGLGSNTLTIDKLQSSGAGVVPLSVDGGPGIDTVSANFAGGNAGNLTLYADLQGGNDVFTATFYQSIGATAFDGFSNYRVARFDVIGGLGNDTLRVRNLQNGEFRTGANQGQFQIDLAGGVGNDTLSVALLFAPELPGIAEGTFHYRLDGGAGNDNVSFSHAASEPNSGSHRHDITVTGGWGNDVVSFAQQTYGVAHVWIGGEAVIDGGFGTDACGAGGSPPFSERRCES